MVNVLKRHLYLRLQPVIILAADILATETTRILQLHTALLIEPVLDTQRQIRLIPAIHLRITIEGLTTGHNVEGIHHWDGSSDITTTAAYLSILTTEPLSSHAQRTGFLIFCR